MKKSTKTALIVALCFIFAGILICVGVLIASDFKLGKLDSSEFITNEYSFSENINSININLDTANIEVLISEDNTCNVTCYEDKKLPHKVALEDGTLTVTSADKHWYDHIKMFSFRSPKITLTLPEEMYASLNVSTDTGDISAKSISATHIAFETDTGHINMLNTPYSEHLSAETDTGSITIENTYCNTLSATSDTGDIILQNTKATDIEAETDTGDLHLQNTISEGNISAETSTGHITFENSDGKNIYAQSSTGDITGTILSTKNFTASSSTGRVNVPSTQGTGIFEASTSTGDITISYANTQ